MGNRSLVPLRLVCLTSQSALSPEGSGSGLDKTILYIYPLIDLYLFYFIRKWVLFCWLLFLFGISFLFLFGIILPDD